VSPDGRIPWQWPSGPVVTSVSFGIGEESFPHFLQGLAEILVFPQVFAPAGIWKRLDTLSLTLLYVQERVPSLAAGSKLYIV